MNKADNIKRAITYYISMAAFFILLPIVLSYSLGYKIDYSKLKIYKTGIISLKSKPSGASIYVNGRLLQDLTPARIEELKPGVYSIAVKRDGFYPWQKDIVVRPNMVTQADDIVLFPLAQELKNVGPDDASNFVVSDKKEVYYFTAAGLFKSNPDGAALKRITFHSNWPNNMIGRKFSPDGNKLMFFTPYSIWVIYFNMDKTLARTGESAAVEEVLRSSAPIIDAFWYSESNHIVFVTDSDIKVVELSTEGSPNSVTLYKFNSRPRGLHYDTANDHLYFTDTGDGGKGPYVHRLELRQKFFDQFMKIFRKEPDVKYEAR